MVAPSDHVDGVITGRAPSFLSIAWTGASLEDEMTMARGGIDQTNWSRTAFTPGTFSAATTSACRSRLSVVVPQSSTTPLRTIGLKKPAPTTVFEFLQKERADPFIALLHGPGFARNGRQRVQQFGKTDELIWRFSINFTTCSSKVVAGDGQRVRRHDLADLASVGAGVLLRQPSRPHQEFEPARTPTICSCLGPPQKVALRYDSDQVAFLIDHRQSADPILRAMKTTCCNSASVGAGTSQLAGASDRSRSIRSHSRTCNAELPLRASYSCRLRSGERPFFTARRPTSSSALCSPPPSKTYSSLAASRTASRCETSSGGMQATVVARSRRMSQTAHSGSASERICARRR